MIAALNRVPARDRLLTPTAAARLADCSRATILAAALAGRLRAFCEVCRQEITREELKADGHNCPHGPSLRKSGAYNFLFKPPDVKAYRVDPTHRASGLASAKSKAKARKAG